MSVRTFFTALSRLARLAAMLAIVLAQVPASPAGAASSPAVSPAPSAVRTDNSVTRLAGSNTALAGRWAAAVQPARAPDAVSIQATKTDALQNDVPPAGPTAGDTIRYTVVVANSGSTDATDVAFADTIDANTTLSGAAHVSPIAFDDSYSSLGNVGITVPAANGVLANDVDPDNNVSLSVVPAAGATAHGTYAMAANGGFSYQPSPGYEGPDSFTYTLTDNDPLTPNDTGTVNITVNDVIWFIDNTAAGPGTGVLSDPFTSITGFNNVAADETGDIIFVYQGVGSYPGAFTLLNQQQLIGQGVDLAAAAGLTVPPYSNALPGATANSLLTNLSGNAITLGNSNILKGLTVGNTSGAAINGNFFGTLIVRNVSISGSGTALNLSDGALDAIFDNIASTGTTGNAISLNTVAGSLTVSNPGPGADTNIAGASLAGISIGNAPSAASYSFGETSIGSASFGVLLQGNNSGTITAFDSLAITVSNGQGLNISNGGVINLGGTASTISATNDSAIFVNGQASFGSGATFASVSSANASVGISLNLASVTGDLTMNGGSITGSIVAGVSIDGGGSSSVIYAGSITNTLGRSASVTGRTGGTVTLSGAINDTGSGILVQNNTDGSTIFSGSSKVVNTGSSQAVTLSNNGGHTITFSNGGLAITTTSATGFVGSGGAAGINVIGANNTINSTTGTAIDIANTTIGGSGITFRSVSSGASGNVGISLVNTGTAGGLTVTGDGSTAGSGGTISGKTGNTDGVIMNNTKNASLAYMNINNNSRNGIYGTGINGLTLTGVTLDGNADQFSPDEAGLLLEEVIGVVNISNTTVKNSYEHNVKVINSGGTLTAFNVTGGTIGPNPVGTGAQGLLFQGNGAASMTLSVNGTTFTGNQSNGIFADTSGGTMAVTIQNSTFLDNNVGPGVSVSSSGNMTFNILNNNAYSPLQVQSIGINVFAAASHTGTFVGTIAGNFVGQANSTASGSIDGNGIRVADEGGGTVTVLINNNTVREVGNGSSTGFEGIFVIKSVTAGTLNATVTNNTMDRIRDDRGLQVRSILGTVCSDIRGNQFSNIGGSTFLRVSQAAPGVFNLVQTSQANLSTVNNGATTTVSGVINFGAFSNCPIPSGAPESPAGQPDATTATNTVAAATGSNAGQPRAAGRAPAFGLPIDQPAAPVRSAATPASAADQSTNLPIYQSTAQPISRAPASSRAPESGETINVTIGTLPAGKSVTIVFDVTIDAPTSAQGIFSQVCNQGTVSGTDFSPVDTDDPDVGGASDPTCTAMQPGNITIAKDQVPDGSDIFGFTSTIPGNASFNVTGDTSLPINNVTPGSYTVTEDDPAPPFGLIGLVCSETISASRCCPAHMTPPPTSLPVSIWSQAKTVPARSTTHIVILTAVTWQASMLLLRWIVLVTWETVSELNNAGFNLYRTGTADPPSAADLLAYIPSQGPGSAQGFSYDYKDYEVTPGETYWYWLEDVDFSGNTTMHGAVSVTVVAEAAVVSQRTEGVFLNSAAGAADAAGSRAGSGRRAGMAAAQAPSGAIGQTTPGAEPAEAPFGKCSTELASKSQGASSQMRTDTLPAGSPRGACCVMKRHQYVRRSQNQLAGVSCGLLAARNPSK
ncbi:MAG: Ig-like domain-containing protein [Caldilineales bacterium]